LRLVFSQCQKKKEKTTQKNKNNQCPRTITAG